MRYLKLFEDHKETSNKISQIQSEADSKTKLAIEEYKSLLDQFMFDITDDYDTSSKIEIVDADRSLDRMTKTYVHYTIEFIASEYDTFLSKLKEVIERLVESEDITYYITGVFEIEGGRPLPGRPASLRHPFDISKCKESIRNHIRDNYNNYPEDLKLKLKISF